MSIRSTPGLRGCTDTGGGNRGARYATERAVSYPKSRGRAEPRFVPGSRAESKAGFGFHK